MATKKKAKTAAPAKKPPEVVEEPDGEVNVKTTAAVTQAGTELQGSAPAMAAGLTYQSWAQAAGLSFQSAVLKQQQTLATGHVALMQGVFQMLGFDTAADAAATSKTAMSDVPTAAVSDSAAAEAMKQSK